MSRIGKSCIMMTINMENNQVRTVHEARWVAAASEDFHPNPRLKVRTYNKQYVWSLPRMADPQSTKAMTRMTLKWIICHAKMWYRTDHLWHADLWVLKTVSFCGKHIFYFLWAEKKSGTFFQISGNNTPGALQSSRESVHWEKSYIESPRSVFASKSRY